LPNLFLEDAGLKATCDVLESVVSNKELMKIYEKWERSLIDIGCIAETSYKED
jgi:hypothetical protein